MTTQYTKVRTLTQQFTYYLWLLRVHPEMNGVDQSTLIAKIIELENL